MQKTENLLKSPATLRINRRLSVIVSADVAGYSRLKGADETGTLSAFKQHREAIDPIFADEGGRLVKSADDRLLLEFPSAFHAIHASLAVQRTMAERNKDVPPDKQLVFRMGMHLGDVLADAEDASGDGIDIAERLQKIADPGGICLSGAAHTAVHKDFDSLFRDGGSKALKDVDAPVHVYKLAPEAAMLAVVPAVTVPRQLLSLIVLPFANSSGDSRCDFLADAITDQLTSELARIDDSFVVDRKTALAAAAFADDLTALGQRLGIRYVIKGGVSAGAAGLRVDAVVIDTETRSIVWDDHIDIASGDPFVMQHDAGARLVPLVYTRLLTATGHTRLLASSQEFQPLTAAASALLASAEVAREPASAATVQIAGLTTAEPDTTGDTPYAAQTAAPPPDRLAALLARWPVLRRPPPRRPVELARLTKPASAPEITPQEPPLVPAVIIRPRTELVPGREAGRVVTFRRLGAEHTTQPLPSPYAAKIGEMPIPSRTDRPEWRLPLLTRLSFTIAAAAVGGAVAVAARGFQHDTAIAIICWILIAIGLTQLICVAVETVQSIRLSRMARSKWPSAERAPRVKRPLARIISVRAVLRSPRGTSRSTRYAP